MKKGDCILIVYPPGLDFIFAHFGCLLAGCVSVPVYPPIPGRSLKKGVDKLHLIQESCNAKVALTNRQYNMVRKMTKLKSPGVKWPELEWHSTSGLKWKKKYAVEEVNIHPDDLAFLQYTSGSTGDPKGVMILHRNYLHNVCLEIRFVLTLGLSTVGLCWLPQYHDLGLIGCYSGVVVVGGTLYAMSPFTFLKQPAVWLHFVSRYRCNCTAAPNFAFELAVSKWFEPKDGHTIDLSSVVHMGNGAEPVRLETLDRFYSLFSDKYKLPRGVIHPEYGLAETCIFGCIDRHILTHVDNQSVQRICCGNVDVLRRTVDVDIRIIDPDAGVELPNGQEGEIVISSSSVAGGYMNREELSKDVFQFALNNRHYLRTGDLGIIDKPDREWTLANPDKQPTYGQDDQLLE